MTVLKDDDRRERDAAGQNRSPFEALFTLANDSGREHILVADVLSAMGHRALIVLILVFALPNVVPVPLGTSAVLGTPLLFLTVELALGKNPWLPRAITRWSFPREDLAALMKRAAPWLLRLGESTQPRLSVLVQPLSVRLIGFLCAVLALILWLPIPFGNIPPAMTISVLALGLLRRDGVWVLAGILAALASIALVWGVSVTLIRAGVELLLQMLK
jgi:hypothetical protein